MKVTFDDPKEYGAKLFQFAVQEQYKDGESSNWSTNKTKVFSLFGWSFIVFKIKTPSYRNQGFKFTP